MKTHTHIRIHTLAFWLCVPFKWIFLYPLFLQSHIYIGHVCLPLSPPSVPPFCHSLNLFLSWGSTVWPQLPLTHALLKLQPINRESSVPVSDVASANWNQQQPVVSANEHFCLCVLGWWMRRMEELPQSHGDHPVISYCQDLLFLQD